MDCRPDELEALTTRLTEEVRTQVRGWVEDLEGSEGRTLEQLEHKVRHDMQTLGRQALEELVALRGSGKEPGGAGCPECGAKGRFIREQEKHVTTLLGSIRIVRAYYYCDECETGFTPLDQELGLGAQGVSPGVEESICWTTTYLPFAEAEKYLRKLMLVEVDDNSVQRVVHQVGAALYRRQAAEVAEVWEWSEPPAMEQDDPPERLYIAADGTNVHLEAGWKEAKVAAIYETEWVSQADGSAEVRAVDITYVVSFEDAPTFAQAVYVEAARRGLHAAEEVIVLGDGAEWIWNHIGDLADDPLEILDFYHACQHIWRAAHALYDEEDPRAAEWVDNCLEVLFHDGVAAFLEYLWRVTSDATGDTRDVLRQQLTYFTKHKQRMPYAQLQEAGYHIGSGSVESACGRILSRLKGAGMIWSRPGARAMAHVRATFLGDRWDAFWADYNPARAAA